MVGRRIIRRMFVWKLVGTIVVVVIIVRIKLIYWRPLAVILCRRLQQIFVKRFEQISVEDFRRMPSWRFGPVFEQISVVDFWRMPSWRFDPIFVQNSVAQIFIRCLGQILIRCFGPIVIEHFVDIRILDFRRIRFRSLTRISAESFDEHLARVFNLQIFRFDFIQFRIRRLGRISDRFSCRLFPEFSPAFVDFLLLERIRAGRCQTPFQLSVQNPQKIGGHRLAPIV